MEKTIITIGRQFGAGGREMGKKLAGRLSIVYYDKEFLLGYKLIIRGVLL